MTTLQSISSGILELQGLLKKRKENKQTVVNGDHEATSINAQW
jgi:hypothetical protein